MDGLCSESQTDDGTGSAVQKVQLLSGEPDVRGSARHKRVAAELVRNPTDPNHTCLLKVLLLGARLRWSEGIVSEGAEVRHHISSLRLMKDHKWS